ncbi:MAG: apolipoprotein N-acyltransferase [Burkholderiales bacterium PBB4]|nr:MAG: apolipoprotein N-acyltransferase [Burkholderiales bacterium PBB4]
MGLTGILASAALSGLYVYNVGGAGWLLGFVVWVPWLLARNQRTSFKATMLCAYGMTVATTATGFSWFGAAIGSFTQAGSIAGTLALLLAAPLFQPQIWVFAGVRFWATRQMGPWAGGLAAVAAWVTTEWLVPKVLGDTFGHGLYPSAVLRQNAAWGGAAVLTAALLLTNECVARAFACRGQGAAAIARSLALALGLTLLLAGAGLMALHTAPPPSGTPLRVGLVQANIVDYERLRHEKGTHAVVRQILDTHFAMSYDAVERQKVDAVLWSETVYPTTFAQPKSSAGAELDQEILGIVNAAQVPFVFGTYDQDAAGEYNAAAFVTPGTGLIGMYRKSRLFPFTEQVPPWLDGSTLRRWLPWVGNWQPGNGARVFPLRLSDGREIPVLPLICLDDVDTNLALQGARLGAQAILTLSNDSWFTTHPQGAKLHQAVAAFRSIETGLPQFRVTTNGYSAAIDATGATRAEAPMGARHVVVGDLPVPVPAPTLMVRWGDWVGQASAAALLVWALVSTGLGLARHPALVPHLAFLRKRTDHSLPLNARVFVLPPLARLVAGGLRAFARGSLLWMGAAMLLNDNLQSNTLAQIRVFTTLFVAPELASWCVLWAFAARATIAHDTLVLRSGSRSMQLALKDIAALAPWRLPVPGRGVHLTLASGTRWPYALQVDDPAAFSAALAAAGGPAPSPVALPQSVLHFAHPALKFGLLPTVLALAGFRLHQHIAYGSSFGEYYTFGLGAYALSFGLWWAAWFIGVVLCAAALRATIEIASWLIALLWPAAAMPTRSMLEGLGLLVLYAGLPGWLALRAWGG